MSAVHYEAGMGVACGEGRADVGAVTNSPGLVTCFACRRTDIFKRTQVTTDFTDQFHGPTLQEGARHLLGYYHLPGGYMPGGFTTKLIELFEKADPTNRAKLAASFPELGYVAGLLSAGHESLVRDIAEGRVR